MKKIIITSILLFTLFGCTPVKTTENKEPTIVIAQTGASETNKVVTTNSGGNITNNISNKENSWHKYSDSEFGFSVSYPQKAYMKTTCGNNTKDELIPLSIYKKVINSLFDIQKNS